jgi:hypothetical protein
MSAQLHLYNVLMCKVWAFFLFNASYATVNFELGLLQSNALKALHMPAVSLQLLLYRFYVYAFYS